MTTSKKIPTTSRKRSWWGFFLLTAFAGMVAARATAGVLVAPSVVFMSDDNRTGRMTVQNPTNAPKEVTISFSFGLPESDSLGDVNITLQDSNVTDTRSALGWIRAFPRKLIIPANGSQIVRFVASPPKGLLDGEYWARIVVESQEGVTTVPTASENEQITTKLNMIMRTAIMLKYRTGNCVAELKLNGAEAKQEDSTVEVLVDLTNTGNVSYVGILACRLLDSDNKQVSSNDLQLAVYHDLKRRMLLPVKYGNFRAPYKVEVSISNKGRKDIPSDDMIFGNDILYTVNLN